VCRQAPATTWRSPLSIELEVLVKATPLRSLLSLVTEELGEAAKARILDRAAREFPAESARLQQHAPIASDRFPVVFLNRLIELTADELHEPHTSVAHRVGRRGAQDASTGVMRLAMTLLSIPSLLRKLGPVWSQMYTHGTMENTFGEKSGVVELKNFPVVSKTGCARVSGTLEWFGEQAEKNFRITHLECRANGASECRWQLRW
jgi:hypothetical protein